MSISEIEFNGWTAVPIDAMQLFNGKTYRHVPEPLLVTNMQFPSNDPVVVKIQDYAEEKLPPKTFNHSMRVFYYATAIIQQQFPEHAITISPSTVALTALLHDLGTSDENISATRMSFEFYGAFKSLHVLRDSGSSQDQADAVCEAIIRHQDLGTEGSITFLGQVIQLATIFDNASDHPSLPDIADLIHEQTREDVIKAFPRTGWLGCFASTVRREITLKPWSHTTHIDNFEKKILGNRLMQKYE